MSGMSDDYRNVRIANYFLRELAGPNFQEIASAAREALIELGEPVQDHDIDSLLAQCDEDANVFLKELAAGVDGGNWLSAQKLAAIKIKANSIPQQSGGDVVLKLAEAAAIIIISIRIGNIEATTDGFRLKFHENKEKLSASLKAVCGLLDTLWSGASKKNQPESAND